MENQPTPAKKSPIMIIVVVIVVIGIAVGVYFLVKDGESTETTNTTTTNTNTTTASRYTGNSFSVDQPEGWQTGQATGTLVTFQDTSDSHPAGSAADAINFMTYMTVISDVVNSQTVDEIMDFNIESVLVTYPDTTFSAVTKETIDGQAAAIVEGELDDSGLVLGILIAIVPKGESYFIITANTTTEKWSEYKPIFYETVRSFEFEY